MEIPALRFATAGMTRYGVAGGMTGAAVGAGRGFACKHAPTGPLSRFGPFGLDRVVRRAHDMYHFMYVSGDWR